MTLKVIYGATLKQRVTEYIDKHPGCTVLDLSRHFCQHRKSLAGTLTKLRKDCLIKNGDEKRDGLITYYRHQPEDDPALIPKQPTKKAWPALKIEKQNPFSALFLSK